MAATLPAEPPVAFRTVAELRAWLARHHATKTELRVRCYRVHARARGVTHAQAVDEALCFGWIDGIRRSLDRDSFDVRFTPRRKGSIWSAVNLRRVAELEAEGRMRPSGLVAFRGRDPKRAGLYSFEARPQALAPAYARAFRAKPRAWAFYQAQAPWYRRTSAFWVMSAKQETTRARRLARLVDCCARGLAIPSLTGARLRPVPPTGSAKRAPRKPRS